MKQTKLVSKNVDSGSAKRNWRADLIIFTMVFVLALAGVAAVLSAGPALASTAGSASGQLGAASSASASGDMAAMRANGRRGPGIGTVGQFSADAAGAVEPLPASRSMTAIRLATAPARAVSPVLRRTSNSLA